MASMLLAASCLSTSTVFPEATTDSLFWIISDPPSLTAWEAAEQWCNSAVALSWPCIAVGNWKKDYIECMVVGCCNHQQSPFHYSVRVLGGYCIDVPWSFSCRANEQCLNLSMFSMPERTTVIGDYNTIWWLTTLNWKSRLCQIYNLSALSNTKPWYIANRPPRLINSINCSSNSPKFHSLSLQYNFAWMQCKMFCVYVYKMSLLESV